MISCMNELTEAFNLGQDEMKNRLSDLEARFNALEARLEAIAIHNEARHADIWKLLEARFNALEARLEAIAIHNEARHADIWKLLEAQHQDSFTLLTEMLQVLPMAVSMSAGEVLSKLTDSIKADIADSRQEIVGKISVSNANPT